MIKKTSEGYQVVSHSGKPLSDNDLSYMQAKDRLKEVDFFKRVKAAKNEGKKPKPESKVKSNPSRNTGGKAMEELREAKKQQDEGEDNPQGKSVKSLTEDLNSETNLNEPNPMANDEKSLKLIKKIKKVMIKKVEDK